MKQLLLIATLFFFEINSPVYAATPTQYSYYLSTQQSDHEQTELKLMQDGYPILYGIFPPEAIIRGRETFNKTSRILVSYSNPKCKDEKVVPAVITNNGRKYYLFSLVVQFCKSDRAISIDYQSEIGDKITR